jgi:hypothetical protein
MHSVCRYGIRAIALTTLLIGGFSGVNNSGNRAIAAEINPSQTQIIAQTNAAIKQAECQQIANVFSAGSGFQNTGNLNASTNLIDNLIVGLQGLNLQDPKLRSLQTRYIQYFTAANQTLAAGQQSSAAGNDAELERLIALAQVSNNAGSALGQELIEYCLQ